MFHFFGKPLGTGFPKYTDNTEIHTYLHTYAIASGKRGLFSLHRPGGIMFLTSQSLEPAQAKVDLGKKVD